MEWMKVIPPLVTLVLKPLKVVTKHVAYPFKVASNVRSLQSDIEKLTAVKNDTQTSITNAERENGEPIEQINLWLRDVQEIEEEAEVINQNYEQLRRCLWNISPNLWSNYKISRNAAKKTVEVQTLHERRATIANVTVQMPPSLVPQMPASSSRSSNLEQALEVINDEVHNIIGIWGMGGVGKTHLLEQINNELSSNGAFDVVLFLTCSKECTEEKVQTKIIERLRINSSDDVEIRKTTIFDYLQKKSFVLLLDDLWNRIDLKQIGISNLSDKRKVVLTTRSTEVCGQMEARKKIKIDVLNEDDAWSLFKEKATEDTINSNPIIKKYAMEVVEELGKLPLALITVGRAMCDKMDPAEWEYAITRLKQARFNDVEFSDSNTVFHILKFSYNDLKSGALKQCFLHCSLWPDDHNISMDELVELWMGLGLIDEHEIPDVYNVGYSYIRKLQAVCLLEETDDDHSIKMHDVIRDMALWIANNQGTEKYKWFVQAGTYKERQVIEVSHEIEIISLMHNEKTEFTFSISGFSTKLSTLLLGGNRLQDAKTLRLDSFCELTVLDLSNNMLETFPTEICKLVHLRFLNISKQKSGFMLLPKDLEALINLRYLLLRRIMCTFVKGVLSKLKALRVLCAGCINFVEATEEFLRRYDSDFITLENEIQCLPNFPTLEIEIINMWDFEKLSQTSVHVRALTVHILPGESILFYLLVASTNFSKKRESILFSRNFLGNPQLQNNLRLLRLEFCSDIAWVEFESTSDDKKSCKLARLEELMFYHMENLKGVVWKGLDPMDVFPRLQVLRFTHCDNLKSISWIIYLSCIRELEVGKCKSIQQLICIGEMNDRAVGISQPSFPVLKKVTLNGNPELESISDGMITFPALESLNVIECNKLKKLPFNTGNPPKKLRLWGTEEWWNNIEMDDSSHRSLLKPFFLEWW